MATGEPTIDFSSPKKPVILITGAAGLIGSRLVQAFAPDFDVVGMDVKANKPLAGLADWVHVDFTRDDAVTRALAEVRSRHGRQIASVIHLAAYYDFAGEPSPMYDELTVRGTERLLTQLRDFEVEQFVVSSSLLVMEPSDEPLTEDSATEAEWDYPQSKLEAEKVIEAEHGSIPVVILRIAGVYDELCHSIPISQQIARIYEKQLESYVFPGDPDSGQAFVHLDDLVDCFRRVVDRRKSLGESEMFIIAEPDVVTYAEMQELSGELIHGEAWPAIRIPKALAKVGAWVKNKMASDDEQQFIKPWMIDLADDTYAVDIAHAKAKLDWRPDHRLRTTLGEIIGRLKADPVGWYKANKLPVPENLPGANDA